MQEYQNVQFFFPKGYVRNWSEDVFVITKDTVLWACYQ